MTPTIIACVAITVAGLVTGMLVHWHHPYRDDYSLSHKLEWYIRSLSFWGLAVLWMAGMCATSTTTHDAKVVYMQYVTVGAAIFVPTAVIALAMFYIRQPTPQRVVKREMDLNK